MTTAEFERRCRAAQQYAYGLGNRLFLPALAGMAMGLAPEILGKDRVPAAVVIVGGVVFMGFTFASVVVNIRREPGAPAKFGLVCAGCDHSLIGGPNDERTGHVRTTGCCYWCRAPVLDDHAGARESAAREAVLAQAPPHPSAFPRDDFDRRFAAARQRLARMHRIFVLLLVIGPPALLGVLLLPLDGAVRRLIIPAGVLLLAGLVVWQLLGVRSVGRRLGIECPACRKVPLGTLDISVLRTGVCPHCAAVMILPARRMARPAS
jgi:hypothetical protein